MSVMKVLLLLFLSVANINFGSAQYYQPASTRCLNPNQRSGTCVSIHDCQTLMSVLQRNPLQPLDRAFLRASECTGGYGKSPHVCCSGDTGFTRTQFDDGPSEWEAETSQETGFVPTSDFNQYENNLLNRQPRGRAATGGLASTSSQLLPSPPSCGGVAIENKIYGGSDTSLYEFPWMVLLEYRRNSGGMTVNCAGSLINQRYVLTAAHCVKGVIERVIGQLASIRLGEHDTTSQIDCSQYSCAPEAIRVGIEETIPHELYKDKSVNKEHDIALVRLDRNIRFSDSIRPICLPSMVSAGELASGAQLTVAGWGATLKSARSPIKQKLRVGLVDQQQCVRKFRQRKVNIVSTQLCSGGKFAEDSCEGDSGGPLMSFRGGAWVLEGIVSFGYKCGLKDWPAVYTRVSSYDDWIRSNMRS